MPASEYRDWQEFHDCEPWGLPVLDAMHANIQAMLANVNRDAEKHPDPYTLEDFLLFPVQGAEDVEPPSVEMLQEAFQFRPINKKVNS